MPQILCASIVLSSGLAMLPVASSAGEVPDLSVWKNVLSFRPPKTVQRKVRDRGRNWAVHRIEDARGQVNLDYYSVHISRLPTIDGHQLTSQELLEHVRKNLNSFLNTGIAEFRPFDQQEAKKWSGDSPLGTILLIDMKLQVPGVSLNPDDGCVIVSEAGRNQWIFSTIRAGGPLGAGGMGAVGHPVSGNRAFGIHATASGGHIFYIIAADRATRGFDEQFAERLIFPAADRLWKSMQEKAVAFINERGGMATIGKAEAKRYDWEQVSNSPYYDTSSQPEWE